MRSAHKLRSLPLGEDQSSAVGQYADGRYAEGYVTAVAADGYATFRHSSNELRSVRVPRHIDGRWLAAAVALAPVPAVVLSLEPRRSPVLAHVFSTPAHAPLDERFCIDAKTIELTASESVEIRTGKSVVVVSANGDIQVRGKNITSRASNVNRVRGGSVRIN